MNKSAVEKWARRSKQKFASDPEGALLDGFQLCHQHAGIVGEKSEALREIERTAVKARVKNFLASSGSFTPDDCLAILQAHKREAEIVYAAIENDINLARRLNTKPSGKGKYLAGLDHLINHLTNQKRQGITAMPPLPEPLVKALRAFNEGAIMLHLGEGDYARYKKEREDFNRHVQQISGFPLN